MLSHFATVCMQKGHPSKPRCGNSTSSWNPPTVSLQRRSTQDQNMENLTWRIRRTEACELAKHPNKQLIRSDSFETNWSSSLTHPRKTWICAKLQEKYIRLLYTGNREVAVTSVAYLRIQIYLNIYTKTVFDFRTKAEAKSGIHLIVYPLFTLLKPLYTLADSSSCSWGI